MFSVHTSKSVAGLLSTRLLAGCVLVLKLALMPAAQDGMMAGGRVPGALGVVAGCDVNDCTKNGPWAKPEKACRYVTKVSCSCCPCFKDVKGCQGKGICCGFWATGIAGFWLICAVLACLCGCVRKLIFEGDEMTYEDVEIGENCCGV